MVRKISLYCLKKKKKKRERDLIRNALWENEFFPIVEHDKHTASLFFQPFLLLRNRFHESIRLAAALFFVVVCFGSDALSGRSRNIYFRKQRSR